MATTNDILLPADTWSDDVAQGAGQLIIQPDSGFTLIAYIGPTKPAADNREGIPIDPKGTRLGAPILSPGDKVFLLSKTGAGSVTVIKASATTLAVRTLLAAGTPRTLVTAVSSSEQALTSGIKGVSIYARGQDAYFTIGSGAQTASATSHYIAAGERLDFDLTGIASPRVAAIFGPSAAAATLHITELV